MIAMLAIGAKPAVAAEFPPGSRCHAFTSETTEFHDISTRSPAWTCQARDWSDRQPVAWLRFGLDGKAKPDRFVTRLSRFESLRIGVIGADGREFWRSYDIDETRPLMAGPRFAVPLPETSGEIAAVVVRIERPGNAAILSEAAVSLGDGDAGWTQTALLLVAALCGLLIAPLAFNIAFYNVLRERFVLWHFAMVCGMLGYTLVSSGLIGHIVPLGTDALAVLNPLLMAIPAAAAGMFAADFIEASRLSTRMRMALGAASVWTLATTVPLSILQTSLYPFGNAAYYLCFLPVVAIYVAAMAQAVRRGSRAVKFQLIGWTPVLLVGLERIMRGIDLYSTTIQADLLIYGAVAIEIMATALGVADRFMVIRRQRDRARVEALVMEGRAERDPLTGLLNRRAVEPRFAELQEQGFVTLAVIDIDRFKSINDTHGHSVGDQVLCATAEALQPDDDTLVMRLGGEEFMLLVRGKGVAERAERRRQAIPGRIAAIVPGLGRPVTASMGLVEYPAGGLIDADFDRLYSHCDRLLYEAKAAGRNRTMRERMQSFSQPRRASVPAA